MSPSSKLDFPVVTISQPWEGRKSVRRAHPTFSGTIRTPIPSAQIPLATPSSHGYRQLLGRPQDLVTRSAVMGQNELVVRGKSLRK